MCFEVMMTDRQTDSVVFGSNREKFVGFEFGR